MYRPSRATPVCCLVARCRGVQYVHWVMHKCIMVKVGGKRNTRKVCKKQVNLCKTGGKICQSTGEIIISLNRGKCTETAKIGGKFEICGRWLKKRSSEISADENQEIFQGKVKFLTFSSEYENFSTIGGKSETGGKMHHGLRGDGRPCPLPRGRHKRMPYIACPINTCTTCMHVYALRSLSPGFHRYNF